MSVTEFNVSPREGTPDEADPMHTDCPGRSIFELITSRWSLMILWSLKGGARRFFEIRDSVEGISERVMSDVLRKLTRHGLISRHVEPSIPPKVSYALTGAGEGLLVVMDGLVDWIGREFNSIEMAKQRFDANAR